MGHIYAFWILSREINISHLDLHSCQVKCLDICGSGLIKGRAVFYMSHMQAYSSVTLKMYRGLKVYFLTSDFWGLFFWYLGYLTLTKNRKNETVPFMLRFDPRLTGLKVEPMIHHQVAEAVLCHLTLRHIYPRRAQSGSSFR